MMNHVVLTGFSDEIDSSFDKQLEAISEFGLHYIELRGADGINVADFSRDKLREVCAKLEERGIQVSSVGSPIGKVEITGDMSEHMDKFSRTLEIARGLKAPYLRMFSFYPPQDVEPEACRDMVHACIGEMIARAKGSGVKLLHENEKGIYGDNARRCLDLMERFGGEQFGAVFDFANFVEVGQDTKEAYAMLKPYIEYIHIKDVCKATGKVVPAGQGDGYVEEILGDFMTLGYNGFLSLEPHLVDFSGLQALEQDVQKRNSVMDGKTAWKTALDALREMMSRLEISERERW